MDFEQSLFISAYQFLATFVDVIPAGATADTEEVADRRCHVAAAVNWKITARAALRDQRADEALITMLDGKVAEIADHAQRCWC